MPYDLPLLPSTLELDSKTKDLLADARQALEGLRASLEFFEDPGQLVQIPALQESVSSSEIENIRTTVQGALEDSVKEDKDKQQGNKEALKYRAAIFSGWATMREYSLSNRTILNIHSTLEVKESGRVRSQQNEIQNEFSQPIYTPPAVSQLQKLLSDWENFVNNNTEIHPIIRAIVSHYQFEAIHPFADGNGRTGRILMVLQLLNDGVLSIPAFYISGYLKENSQRYKELLLEVTEKGEWKNYLNFMLTAFSIQALKTRIIIKNIHMLKMRMKRSIREKLPKIYSSELINALFTNPITFSGVLGDEVGVTRKTSSKYLKSLEEEGFLISKKSGKYLLYMNHELIKILHEKI